MTPSRLREDDQTFGGCTIRLFAGAASTAGRYVVQIEPEAADRCATVGDYASLLGQLYPELEALVRLSRWAVDDQFVDLSFEVMRPAELALIPPVSGG